jgi:hypothetical protein
MENFPKPNKGGRPRKIPAAVSPLGGALGERPPDEQGYLREYFADATRTNRSRANAHYAEGARGVVEHLRDRVELPHDPVLAAKLRVGMDWILARRTVLTELGRLMDSQAATEETRARLQGVVHNLARRHDKLTAKTACAYVRGQRMGETSRRERVASLHHDLNAAINVHRQRYPESTWQDIKRALDLTTGQVERKL